MRFKIFPLFCGKLEHEPIRESIDVALDSFVEITCCYLIESCQIPVKHNLHTTDGVYHSSDVSLLQFYRNCG